MCRLKRKLFIFITIFVLINWCEGISDITNIMKIEAINLRKNVTTFINESDSGENSTEAYIPYDLQIIANAFEKLNNSECLRDAKMILEAIVRRENWALRIFDASAKYPVGILQGAFYQMGNFDECIHSTQPLAYSLAAPIEGKYCLADIQLNNKINNNDGRIIRSPNTKERSRHMFESTIHWGICVPSSCDVKEVEEVVRQIFITAVGHHSISVNINSNSCHVATPMPLTSLEIIYGCIIGIILVFILFATGLHYYNYQQKKNVFICNGESDKLIDNSLIKEIIFCFSIIKNLQKFLQTKSNELNLECICGIRFLSMMFIIAGHTLLHTVGGPVLNTNFYEKEVTNVANAIFTNSPLLVDTFLLISGFLMSYLLLLELDKRKGKINVMVLYVARYIRLTPSYFVVIGLYCSFLYRMGEGPLWDSRIGVERDRCLNSWWTNLLYINNYVNTDSLCMFQSYYLAADYHLFIIAPFIILPLWKYNRIGKWLLGICTLIAITIPFFITYFQQLDPTLMIFAPEVYDITQNFYFIHGYIKTHMRAASYFIGLIFGYLLYRIQKFGSKIPRYILWSGWIISAASGVLSMFSVVVFYFPDHLYRPLEAAIYSSFHRLAWCVSISWILLVCVTNNANLVNRFLSWKPFIPLSRLTYCAYLINGFVEIYSLGISQTGLPMNKFELSNRVLSHVVITFFFAFILCILFESPIHSLEKIMLKSADKRQKSNTREQGDESRI